jgi:DNA invertase Pin-like site-specific DNA recombinase
MLLAAVDVIVACMGRVWAGIVRVSHMGGRKSDDADFHSEREQIAAMQDAIARIGGTLHLLPSELDVSGGLPLEQRPSLHEAVRGVERGTYCGIVVAYQSRLGRDVEVEEGIWRRVERAGGQIVLAMDGIDASTVDGRMIRRIRSAMNTREREAHAARFEQLRERTNRAGIWQFRQVPRGYAKSPQTRRLVPGDDADDVRWAFRARAAGAGISVIADRLGMTTSGVRQLLANRVYLGELRCGKHVNPAAHPALVSLEEWEAAQRSVPRPARSADMPDRALLAGLVRCAGCGHVMSRQWTKSLVYSCHGRHSGGRCPAPASITIRLADEHVERVALSELEKLYMTGTRGGSASAARARLRAAEAELAAYLQAVSAADVGVEAFAAGARQRRDEVAAARGELEREVALVPLAPSAGTAAETWRLLDVQERNTVLRGLVEAVLVASAGKGRRVPVGDRVRVVRYGAGLPWVGLPDFDDPDVIGPFVGEDALEGAGG